MAAQAVAEVMAEGDQVDEVVGMEVADDDGVEISRIELARESRKRSLAEVEQDRRRAAPDQVCGPGRAESIRVGRSRARDEQLE